MELDSKGRITLPKGIRDTAGIGGRVLAVNAGDHLKIIRCRRTQSSLSTGSLT
ncbi:MAG: division/cell wall cluster transcriptional repressor MraZ [Nitrososphaerota archaeon]|nr:division/cell wall cluster transcriptional repressor MraZ [Nitrososphaerota archaeon]MDG6985077.1 division/cell wall cluster transcriptional repressor MraZ [Nitrososphaerota archaeon]